MPTPQQIEQALAKVHDQATFIRNLLVETLQWPIPDHAQSVEEITYGWSNDELRAPELEGELNAYQIANLNPDQPWGVFILLFGDPDVFAADRGMTGALRRVLRGLVPSRRKEAKQASWKRQHLLFICTHDYTQFRFAYFKDAAAGEGQPRLAAFGWQLGSGAVRTVCEFNLSQLQWPDDPSQKDRWVEHWASAFDVEKVTKRFYADYAKEDKRLRQIIAPLLGESDIDAEPAKMFVQTLLNRLMFLRFIERKGWLQSPAGRADRDYLRLLFAAGNYRGKSFYAGRLRKLFFEGLAIDGKQESEAIGKVPFLNGGLFEPKDSDERVADIPSEAFAPLLGAEGLFYRYNFTVEESTPLNIEVAVDPEMLGKVFEELVTGRHESGSYYTPRPIVSFMCREALKGYLANAAELDEATAAALVDRHDTHAIDTAAARRVAGALDELKAVDPACGSGAYLLGLLHEMLDLYRLLYHPDLLNEPRKLYELKLRIISHTIYGVDNDRFATNIAMLRLWLSLSVDSDKPLPLPNLEFKIETGDSLAGPCDASAPHLDYHGLRLVADALVDQKDRYLRAYGDEKAQLKNLVETLQAQVKERLSSLYVDGVIDWRVAFADVLGRKGGFDIVLANPPYVRQELIKKQKEVLKATFPSIYAGAADLCCYFYARAIELLRPGGTLAFISSNKWMRAGYGRNLRSFLLRYTAPKTIVDFGHSPIFPGADTFPCVPILARRKEAAQGRPGARAEVFVACTFPREDYRPEMPIGPYVAVHSRSMPVAFLREDSWSLDDPDIQRLMERIRNTGVPLRQFCKGPLYRGPVTGFNTAFFIDPAKRQQLIAEDRRSAEIIKPLLRGRDIDRWRPRPPETFIIFTRRGTDIAAYPAIERHLSQYREALEDRAGEQAWYELQASPSDEFADVMFRPKIVYQEIQFHSWFSLETEGACVNNKVFLLPTADLALLGILSSPLMWWFLTRTLPHMKDEALCPAGFLMENVPVTTGNAEQTAVIRKAVQRLVELADSLHQWRQETCSEACRMVGMDGSDRRIVGWLSQPPDVFNARLAKLAGRRRFPEDLAAKTTALRANGRARQLALLKNQLELEMRLATLAEDAFGLTADERELLRTTRPVRDPLDVLNAKMRGGVHEEPESP